MQASKFDKLFENAPEPRPEPSAPDLPAHSRQPSARPVGRPPGKRSDPAWKQFSFLLKRDTQRAAAAILLQRNDGKDLSDLMQCLLEGWVEKQKAKA